MFKAILAVSLFCVSPAFSQTANLIARIFNQAGAPPSTLSRAENQATYVLQSAGVQVLWIDCAEPGACDAAIGPNELAILIRTRPAGRRLIRGIRPDALALALLTAEGHGVYAIVYYDDVQLLATQQSAVGVDELMGYVIAHEIGHLLLGPDHHVNTVMKSTWSVRDLRLISQRELHFDHAERDRMQAELRAGRPPSAGAIKLVAAFGVPATGFGVKIENYTIGQNLKGSNH